MKVPEVLVLASASPQRRDLLAAVGIPFEVVPAFLEESRAPGETPRNHVIRIAREKAEMVARRLPDRLVLGADTVIELDGRILGKPGDPGEARSMLEQLSGRSHLVWTGLCLLRQATGFEILDAVSSTVIFRNLSSLEIEAYVETGEPMDKAGAYAIQGKGVKLISELAGSFSNVIGLPTEWVTARLGKAQQFYIDD